jgi:hypothetical protein
MPSKEPGTWGFWEVWGAVPRDLRPGDVLLCKVRDTDETSVDYVAEVVGLGPSGARLNYVNQDGKTMSIGLLAPVVVVRWGTHGTLSDSVR